MTLKYTWTINIYLLVSLSFLGPQNNNWGSGLKGLLDYYSEMIHSGWLQSAGVEQ